MACVGTPARSSSATGWNRPEAMHPRPAPRVPIEAANGARAKAAGAVPRSPEHVQISAAAAITLGLTSGALYRCACTRCLNLLLTYPEGCRANCAYCGLARHREAARDYAERNFIRVDWPTVETNALIDQVARAGAATPFERMCISMITHPRSEEDTFAILAAWTARIAQSAVPVSILSNPTTMTRADVTRLDALGAEIFTVALDAASPEIFARTRGREVASPHSWEGYWARLMDAADIFGHGRFGAHIIIGMGESEHQALELIERLARMGGSSHLFCFYPEQGSLMDHLPATPRGQWRRVQLARYLIEFRGLRLAHMRFDAEGRIADFGVPTAELDAIIDEGTAFRTSGCPGKQRPDLSACDRPYGDSPPRDIASYPFAPEARDVARIRAQLGGEDAGDPFDWDAP